VNREAARRPAVDEWKKTDGDKKGAPPPLHPAHLGEPEHVEQVSSAVPFPMFFSQLCRQRLLYLLPVSGPIPLQDISPYAVTD